MSDKHTPGLLHVDPKRSLRIATDQDESLASTGTSDVLRDSWEANARRLVACWNACEGISTESLESAGNAFNGWKLASYAMNDAKSQRDELLAALRIFAGCVYPVATEINERGYNWSEAYLDSALNTARAAITKATKE